MLENSIFARQDFFKQVDYINSRDEIKSILLSGEPRFSYISVAIPTFKRVHLLREAIDSLYRQSDQDFTIVITDNDPEDDNETQQYIQTLNDPRVIYYKNEENIGALANFNRCIQLTDCTYAVMLCTDDLLSPGYIERLKGLVGKMTDIDMLLPEKDIQYNNVSTKMKGYSSFMRWLNPKGDRDLLMKLKLEDFLMYYPAAGPSGIAYRKNFFSESGGFNSHWHPAGDYILHARMATIGNVYLCNLNSGEYRMIENITLENDMRTIYMIQNTIFMEYLIASGRVSPLWRRYNAGGIYYRLKRNSNKRYGKHYDQAMIGEYVDKITWVSGLCFLMCWVMEAVKFISRINRLGEV